MMRASELYRRPAWCGPGAGARGVSLRLVHADEVPLISMAIVGSSFNLHRTLPSGEFTFHGRAGPTAGSGAMGAGRGGAGTRPEPPSTRCWLSSRGLRRDLGSLSPTRLASPPLPMARQHLVLGDHNATRAGGRSVHEGGRMCSRHPSSQHATGRSPGYVSDAHQPGPALAIALATLCQHPALRLAPASAERTVAGGWRPRDEGAPARRADQFVPPGRRGPRSAGSAQH